MSLKLRERGPSASKGFLGQTCGSLLRVSASLEASPQSYDRDAIPHFMDEGTGARGSEGTCSLRSGWDSHPVSTSVPASRRAVSPWAPVLRPTEPSGETGLQIHLPCPPLALRTSQGEVVRWVPCQTGPACGSGCVTSSGRGVRRAGILAPVSTPITWISGPIAHV